MNKELNFSKLDLHVDLDGTLLKCDLLHEQLVRLLLKKPLQFILAWVQLFKGKAAFKSYVELHAGPIDYDVPLNDDLIEWLLVNSHSFKSTNLITASPQSWADAIKSKYGFFSSAHGSTKKLNLRGEAKAKFIKDKFANSYVYAGDSTADLAVWKGAVGGIVVGSESVNRSCETCTPVLKYFPREFKIMTLFKALRVHQWAKNALIFLPLVLAKDWFDSVAWAQAALAVIAFSLTASSVYLLNDIIDLDSDRKHNSKKNRPLASGDLSIFAGAVLIPIALAAGLLTAQVVGPNFLEVVLGYYVLTSVYSFWLKRLMLVDAIALGCLYSIRIVAGGVATETPLSHWLLAFSTFFFLSLALVKRFTEIKDKADLLQKGRVVIAGRGYRVEDLNVVSGLGLGAGMVSILIFTLYLNDPLVTEKLVYPSWLWLSSLLLLYWLGRVWLLAGRGQMHDDPVVFAVRDKVSWLVMVLIGSSFLYAAGALAAL